jgi:HSP20 family protein
MSLVPWSPWRELVDAYGFPRLFDEALWRERGRTAAFPVDVYETPDSVLVRAELPGVHPDDIRVQWTAGHLVISARRPEFQPEGATPVRVESVTGSFTRSFDLGIRIDADALRADYEDGVLTITAPKAADVRPREVPVSARRPEPDEEPGGRYGTGARRGGAPLYDGRGGRGRRPGASV